MYSLSWLAGFVQANLRNATMQDAHLTGANLSEVDLEGADLSKADLRTADLRDIKWGKIAKVKMANVFRVKDAPAGFLVSCRRNSMPFAAGQLAAFQGASDEHI